MKDEKKYVNNLHYAAEDRFKKISVFGTEIDLESDVEADEIIKCRCGYEGNASDIDTYNWRKKRSSHLSCLYCPECARRMSAWQRFRLWQKRNEKIAKESMQNYIALFIRQR